MKASIYGSPHGRLASAHQCEIDRQAIRDRAIEHFAEDALRELTALAEHLNDALPNDAAVGQLDRLLIEASRAIAENRIKQLEGN